MEPTSILFGVEDNFQNANLVNFLILIYKLLIYKTRESAKPPTLAHFLTILGHYELIESKIAYNQDKLFQHLSKWGCLTEMFQN